MEGDIHGPARTAIGHIVRHLKRCTPENPPDPALVAELRQLIELVSDGRSERYRERLEKLEDRVSDLSSREGWASIAGGTM